MDLYSGGKLVAKPSSSTCKIDISSYTDNKYKYYTPQRAQKIDAVIFFPAHPAKHPYLELQRFKTFAQMGQQ